MLLTWLSNTNIKKTQTSKTQLKEEKRTRFGRERESTPFRATAELLSAVSPPLSRWHLGGTAALFNLENHCTIAMPPLWQKPIKNQWRRTKKRKKKERGAKKLEKTSRNMSKTQIRKTRKKSRNMSNPNRNQQIENN